MKRAIDTSKLRAIPVGTKVKIIKASLLQPSNTVGKIAVIKEVVYFNGKNKAPAYRVSFLDKRFSTLCKLKGSRNYDWTYAWYEIVPVDRERRLESIKHHKKIAIDTPKINSIVKIIKAVGYQPEETIGKIGQVKEICLIGTPNEHYKVYFEEDNDFWFYDKNEIQILKY